MFRPVFLLDCRFCVHVLLFELCPSVFCVQKASLDQILLREFRSNRNMQNRAVATPSVAKCITPVLATLTEAPPIQNLNGSQNSNAQPQNLTTRKIWLSNVVTYCLFGTQRAFWFQKGFDFLSEKINTLENNGNDSQE